MRPEARKVGGKVQKVMHEFGSGKLRSSSGQKVTNPKQAIAIALSEQRRAKKYDVGGVITPEEAAERKRLEESAAKAREEAKRLQSPTPTPAEKDKMKKQLQGQRFARGGAIAKQDTQHGRMDMPFKKLSKFAGMKHGGKVKRYDDGGDVDTAGAPDTTASDTEILKSTRSNLSFKDAFREARNAGDKTFEWQGKKYSTELKPASSASGYAGYAPKRETGTAAYRTAEKMKDAASRGFADLRRKATTEAENPDRMQRILGTRMGQPRFKQGGNVESKKMMAKEVAFMKKKGAPKSMLKHEEAEMKGYARGGKIKEVMGPRTMAKDVEGGSKARHLAHGEHSEQKRGHTRGTVVKMASGGSVRAHGEHSIQKSGHTKGRMV